MVLEPKILVDFGQPEYGFVDDWKSLYKNYGSVYVFGGNRFGQLGLGKLKNLKGDTASRLTPTKIHLFNVRTISAGVAHTVAIDFNDDVWVNFALTLS
jgi:alpha-tubulin suppressor-like RCC1 family protein